MTRGRAARPLWVPFALLAATIVVLDQLTKAWVVGRLRDGARIEIVGDLLRLVYSENSGALFGLFRDQAPLFALVSVAVAVLIVAYHAKGGRSAYLTLTLGLLLGGWAGNFVDRLRLGFVVDFVDAGIGDVRFWTFNLADACISTAIVLLILAAVRPSLAGAAEAAGHPGTADVAGGAPDATPGSPDEIAARDPGASS